MHTCTPAREIVKCERPEGWRPQAVLTTSNLSGGSTVAKAKPTPSVCASQIPFPESKRFRNLTGMKFGRLTVIAFLGKNGRSHSHRWSCRCDCGNLMATFGSSLTCGETQSCGCLQRELTVKRNKTHGKTYTPEYIVWTGIKARCCNPKNAAYPDYGGRGIKICVRWAFSFLDFLEDVGPRPGPGFEIDRFPNNDGDYEPGNVRWVKTILNARNKRNNRRITVSGETLCVSEWSERTGIDPKVIYARLSLGWPEDAAVLTPVERKYSHPRRK